MTITDGYENRAPRLADALGRYAAPVGYMPAVCLVQVAGAGVQLTRDLKSATVPFDVFTLDCDLLGLVMLTPALGMSTADKRIAQIMAMEDERGSGKERDFLLDAQYGCCVQYPAER